MDMKNKEQLLYFFLQGKISLSQYDYKFMANLQTMIQNQNRVTSNQADLFDKLISKYNKQLVKSFLNKEELKALPWKTMVVESTSEYTGATVSLFDDKLTIRVPFNKQFITEFRQTKNNTFEWSKEFKNYSAPFSTIALKVAYTMLPKFFSTVRYDDELTPILNEIAGYEGFVWNPTLMNMNGNLVIVAANPIIGEIAQNIQLSLEPKTLLKLSLMGITVDHKLYETDEKLKFASNQIYEAELVDVETVIGWMKNIGCENVVIGRGLRKFQPDHLTPLIEKYGMRALGPMSFGKLPDGISMLIQHTSSIDVRNAFSGMLSKTIVLKDSRPIEVE